MIRPESKRETGVSLTLVTLFSWTPGKGGYTSYPITGMYVHVCMWPCLQASPPWYDRLSVTASTAFA